MAGCEIAGEFIGLAMCIAYILLCIPKLHTTTDHK